MGFLYRASPENARRPSAIIVFMETDDLSAYLDALARSECYRVLRVLKRSDFEVTEEVCFVGRTGAETGPFIRKRIVSESGMGGAYRKIFDAQRSGRRFRFLPRIFDCYQADGELVVVMEHASGRTLADIVYERDPSVELAAKLFPQICDAVAELHEGFDPPLIHRDLKPSNVIVGEEGITLIDFGIARSYREGAASDTAHFGTRAYAPPEQFGFGQTDERSDVYALGMMLYYCLTEKTPDPQHRRALLADLSIPRSLTTVIDCATAFDPDARYAGVRDLKAAAMEAFDACGAFRIGECGAGRSCAAGIDAGRAFGAKDQERKHVQAKASDEGGRRGDAFRRIGVAWDAVVAFAWLVMVAASVVAALAPTGATAAWSPVRRAVAYFGFMIPLVSGVGLLVLDKRPLARVPKLHGVSRRQWTIVAVALIVASLVFLLVGVLMA